MSSSLLDTKADQDIRQCLKNGESFYVIAGAGSGKTTSLITALDHIRDTYGAQLHRSAQRVVCVTYTKRAVAVISAKLGWDDLFEVSTLHGFLWREIKRYTPDIRRALEIGLIPSKIAKKKEDDNGGNSQKAVAARTSIIELEAALSKLESVPNFEYGDSNFSDYSKGELSHDDVIDVAAFMITNNQPLRRIIGQKYPFIFVDEAQDTHNNIVAALNMICSGSGLPIVGYFGDPMQQIYDKRAGDFKGPEGSHRIPKEENFRCSVAVIKVLNAFRDDIQQFAAGSNAGVEGSVIVRLIQTEKPAGPRNRYTIEQIERTSAKLDDVLAEWQLAESQDLKQLFLVRQMIARRLRFANLHALFTGDYSSSRSQDDYESGEHFLLKPFVVCLYPIVRAFRSDDPRVTIDLLRRQSPAFDPQGDNSTRTLQEMRELASNLVSELVALWGSKTVGEVLRFGRSSGLCPIPKRLISHLDRPARAETYDKEIYVSEKIDWLADEFFNMKVEEVENFCEFVQDKTAFSTQHGVKGEQYPRVLVVFDDVGSAWNNYNFSKTLMPKTFGSPTDRQRQLSENLAYVCFSRAEQDLRIVMFSENPEAAKQELVDRELFHKDQIEISG